MKVCPNCGSSAWDDDKFSSYCGKLFEGGRREQSAISTTKGRATQGATRPRGLWKDLVVVGAALLVLFVIGAGIYFAFYSFSPIATIGGVALRGNRTVGYTASFYLIDSHGRIASADGMVSIHIKDGRLSLLYRMFFILKASDFNVVNQSSQQGVSGPGYLWKIPAWEVGPGVSSSLFEPSAQISFLALSGGENFTSSISGGFKV